MEHRHHRTNGYGHARDQDPPPAIFVVIKEGSDEELHAKVCKPLVPRAMIVQDALRLASLTSLDLSGQNITSITLKVGSDYANRACLHRELVRAIA
jgi:hypothetical protein